MTPDEMREDYGCREAFVTYGLVFDGPHEARAVVELAVAVTATTDAARAAGGV